MKHLHTKLMALACCMAGLMALSACSDADDTSMYDLCTQGTQLRFYGVWDIDYSSKSNPGTQQPGNLPTADVGTSVKLSFDVSTTATFDTMPIALFAALAGVPGAEPINVQPYTAELLSKGYSSNTQIYQHAPDNSYRFTCRHGGKSHYVRVEFDEHSELSFDSYTRLLFVSLEVAGVYIDGQLVDSPRLTLSLDNLQML